MKTQVLLSQNVASVGRCGDLVKVAPGFARNFLYPRKLAIPATDDNLKQMQRRRARLDAEDAQRSAEIDARVAALAAVSLRVQERADESGQLFGSVSAGTIARLLTEAGQRVEERDVRLEQPIKSVGEYKVQVHVHGELHAEIALAVEATS
jgi:large subunit ribosomal protein L9